MENQSLHRIGIPTTGHIQDLPVVGGLLILDFLNTVSHWNEGIYKEYFASMDDWKNWLNKMNLASDTVNLHVTDNELKDIQKQRNRLYNLLRRLINSNTLNSSDLKYLNKGIAVANANLLLVYEENSFIFRWSFNTSLSGNFLNPIFKSLEKLLLEIPKNRIKQCDKCNWFFYDQTKSRTRKWCDMKYCGSRSKAMEYYRRTKSG